MDVLLSGYINDDNQENTLPVIKIDIRQVCPSSNDVTQLFRLLDEHNMSFCSPEICHLLQPEEMLSMRSTLFGAYFEQELCGMGGLKYGEGYAEVTRMFVRDEFRGNGIALQILRRLEDHARSEGFTKLMLETSDKFERAVRLYSKYGFVECEPFGEYVNKPYNTYFELDIKLDQREPI